MSRMKFILAELVAIKYRNISRNLQDCCFIWQLFGCHRKKLFEKYESYTLLTSKFILWSSSSTEWGLPLALDPQCLTLYFLPEWWCPPVTRWHIFSLRSSTFMNLKFPTRLCSTPLHSPLAFFATTSITSPFCGQKHATSLSVLCGFTPIGSWVSSSERPTRLYYTACSHIWKLCILYKNCTVI